MKEERKNCLFQYASDGGLRGIEIIEDTDLITRSEADKLWDKCYPDAIERLKKGEKPEIVIWINCIDNQSYNKRDETKHFDYRNLIFENGRVYKEL
jgi:hypothetical protein